MDKIDKEEIRLLCDEDRNIVREDKINELVNGYNEIMEIITNINVHWESVLFLLNDMKKNRK